MASPSEQVKFETHNPDFFSASDWQGIQLLQYDSLRASIPEPSENAEGVHSGRSGTEIAFFTGLNDFGRFHASHLDPNTEVGRKFGPNQEFSDPKVVVATINDGEIIGWGYGAGNVSGSTEDQRDLKKITLFKNYFWVREVSVSAHPDYRGQGIGHGIMRGLARIPFPLRPMRTYVYKDETPYVVKSLEGVGFRQVKADERTDLTPFGDNTRPTSMMPFGARTACEVKMKTERL